MITSRPISNSIDIIAVYADARSKHFSDDPERDRRESLFAGNAISVFIDSVMTYAGWFNRLFLVALDPLPDIDALPCSRVSVIHPVEFMPEEYKDSHNLNAVELNLHRIRGLSEQFIYFSPGSYLCNPVKSTFFFSGGLPRDYAIESLLVIPDMHERHMQINNMLLIQRISNRQKWHRRCLKKILVPHDISGMIRNLYFFRLSRRSFFGFEDACYPLCCLKKNYAAVWEEFTEELDKTCRRPEISEKDVNYSLIRYYQYVYGLYLPFNWRRRIRSIESVTELSDEIDKSYKIAIVRIP